MAATAIPRRCSKMPPRSLFLLVGMLGLIQLAECEAIDCSFNATYPRQYVAYRASYPPVLDGSLTDPQWTEVPWTEDFVDISTNSTPWLTTNAKIRFDDRFLYVGARLHDVAVWANISSTCHCVNATQDQVIYHGAHLTTTVSRE